MHTHSIDIMHEVIPVLPQQHTEALQKRLSIG